MNGHQPKGGINQLQPVNWLWLIMGLVVLGISGGYLHAAEGENAGTWYEEDTLYVFTVKIPDNRSLTSMKVQEKQDNRYITVGSPRIQVIPSTFIGKEIIFTRSKYQIDLESGERDHLPEFRLAFYEEGLTPAGYGDLGRALKPSVNVDIQLVSQRAYPTAPADTILPVVDDIEEEPEMAAVSKSGQAAVPVADSVVTTAKPDDEKTTQKPEFATAPVVAPEPPDTLAGPVDSVKQAGRDMKKTTDQKQIQPVGTKKPPTNQQKQVPANSVKPSQKRKPPPKAPSKAPWGTVFNQGILNGLSLEVSAASPYWVSENLTTWYSSIDWRFSFTMPFYYHWGSVMMGLSFEWSSYDFENTFPEGGRFQGQAQLGYMSAYWRGLILELGGGKFTDTYGIISGISGKILEGDHFYFGGGVRGVIIRDIQSIGQGHWADGRLTLGYKF